VKQIYEMKGAGHSAREIARELGLARNTVLRYLKSPEAMHPKARSRRGSKLDPYAEHIDRRMGEGLENCVVLLRELRELGYDGRYTILSEYVRPRRRRRQPEATMRFETGPGEQAQVDWGSLSYRSEDGKRRSVWVFVMTMGYSRACYVELVRRADTAAFIQCHVNAFEYLGGVPRRCLYDNAKVVTLGPEQTPVITEYGGTTFRSQLEARWAAYFDRRGIAWEYEPAQFNGWTPDFRLVLGGDEAYAEVKPVTEFPMDVAQRVLHAGCGAVVLILGNGPRHAWLYRDGGWRSTDLTT